MKLKKSIVSKNQDKITLFRHIYFTSFRIKGRRNFMLLKAKRYIQVGLSKIIKKLELKYLLYKTLHFSLNNLYNFSNKNKDYLSIIKTKKRGDDYSFNFRKRKKVLGFDLFYCNKLLNVKNFVPLLLSKFEYNFYDKNYIFFKIFDYYNMKNLNNLYLQSYEYRSFSYLYLNKLYLNIKNIIYLNISNILPKYYLYLNNNNKHYISNIFKVAKLKYVKFGMFDYIKIKNALNLKQLRLLDKYLIKNKMFRAGKFFYNFLEYMKNFSYNVYRNNLLYNKFNYTKLDGNKNNIKLMTFNVDKLKKLKGWLYIYNYIKKYSFLNYNENKKKVVSQFIKKYHFFYYFMIRFFYKIIQNLKFLFIEKFSFKKIQFFKILVFYIFHNNWYRFRTIMKRIKRKKIKRFISRRILRTRHLGYVRFLLRIKNRVLTAKYLARLKLERSIKKRKRLHFFKFKNSIRVVNWLLKLRRFKSIKNPFKKPFWKLKKRGNINFKNNKFKLNKNNKFKQLSTVKAKIDDRVKGNNDYRYRKNALIKANVKRF